jgi:peroxidase
VIEANTQITNLQSDVFLFRAAIAGTVFAAGSSGHPPHGASGITVHLLDADGIVVATTHTDAHGNYVFTEFSGPAAGPTDSPGLSATGTYTVELELPPGGQDLGPDPAPIQITRGDTVVLGVNFHIGLPPL